MSFIKGSNKQNETLNYIFTLFNELTHPSTSVILRMEILHRVFSILQKCDKTWKNQLDILDVFGSILESKPEILFGCNNILDNVITMIENIESNINNNNNIDIETRITTIHCKLCHIISLVGRTQLTVEHLNRLMILLRDSLLFKNRHTLASLLLTTLRDMIEHSPPNYNSIKNNISNVNNIVNVFSDSWFKSNDNTNDNNNPSNIFKIKNNNNNNSNNSNDIPLPNTLLRIIHQLPLNSFAFLNNNCGIIIPMKSLNIWPFNKGFTFICWLLWTQLDIDPYSQKKNNWMCIFSMLTVSGYGIDISLCSKTGQIKFKIVSKNFKQEKIIPKVRLLSTSWYYLGITHIPSRTSTLKFLKPIYSNGFCKIYINGKKIIDIDLQYPTINEPPRYTSIGMSSHPIKTNNKPSPFTGQIGSIYLFQQPLSSNHVQKLYTFGANFRLRPEVIQHSPTWLSNVAQGIGSIVTPLSKFGSNIFTSIGNAIINNNNNSNNNNNNSNIDNNASPKSNQEIQKLHNNLYRTTSLDASTTDVLSGTNNVAHINDTSGKFFKQTGGGAPLSKITKASNIELNIFSNLMLSYHPLGTFGKLCINICTTNIQTLMDKLNDAPNNIKKSNNKNNISTSNNETKKSNKYEMENAMMLHGALKTGMQNFNTSDVRDIFHCSVGGILSIYPVFIQAKKFYDELNKNNIKSTDTNIIGLTFDLITQLLHFSQSNKISIKRANGIATLAYLLNNLPNYLKNKKLLNSIINLCSHLSWLGYENLINSKTTPPADMLLFSHLPPSLSTSDMFKQLRPNMNISNAKNKLNLFNQAVNYLIFNFEIWHKKDIPLAVENQLCDIITEWALDQPQYMYHLLNIEVLLDEIKQHYSYNNHKYLPDKSELKNEKDKIWLWNIRQFWFRIVTFLIRYGKQKVDTKNIDLLIQMTLELTDPLESGDMMEVIVSLFGDGDNYVVKRYLNKIKNERKLLEFHLNLFKNDIFNHINKNTGIKLYGLLFRQQCSTVIQYRNNKNIVIHQSYLQVCCLHLINVLLNYTYETLVSTDTNNTVKTTLMPYDEQEKFVTSLINSFMKIELPLPTYHAFLEILLGMKPGDLGARHGTEFYIKSHEIITSKYYSDKLFEAKIRYPQGIIQLLRIKYPNDFFFQDNNNKNNTVIVGSKTSNNSNNNNSSNNVNMVKIADDMTRSVEINDDNLMNVDDDMNTNVKFEAVHNEKLLDIQTYLQDLVSLFAISKYKKDNSNKIVCLRGFQEPLIKMMDFSKNELQSKTNTLSWYSETILDLLLQNSLMYDQRGWKILRDTLRLMRQHCDEKKIDLLHCVRSQCYFYIRILKRLSRLIIQENELQSGLYNNNIVRMNIVRSLELIERIIYEIPPGLCGIKLEDKDWILCDQNDQRKVVIDTSTDEMKSSNNNGKSKQDPLLADSENIDSTWLMLVEAIIKCCESIPKCNLSPQKYANVKAPPMRSGSPV